MATTFAYKVKDREGQVHSGEMEGSSQSAVSKALRDRGYQPISVGEKKDSALQKEIRIPGLTDRVKLKEVVIFSRQFATMINAGLSLLRSLSILADQTPIAFVFRIDRDCGFNDDSCWSSRSNDEITITRCKWVTKMPQVPIFISRQNFEIR